MANEKSSPGVSAVLSFVVTGLGQLYNGQITKGLLFFFFASVGLVILIFGALLFAFRMLGWASFPGQIILGSILFLLGLAITCILGIYSILDAFRTAQDKVK